MERLDKKFWTSRYEANQTGWDIGHASPALLEFAQKFPKDASILIPGAGNAHEWAALHNMGYTNTFALDISHAPIERLRSAFPKYEDRFITGDFFEHTGTYDLILEQTFFCALQPGLRKAYVKKMAALLRPQGVLAGVLFSTEFERTAPPFGGTQQEYRELFRSELEVLKMEPCYNSVTPRIGNEDFFIARIKR